MEVLQTVKGVNIQDDKKTFDPYQEAANSHHISMSNILALYFIAIVIESNGLSAANKKKMIKIHKSYRLFCACDPTLLV